MIRRFGGHIEHWTEGCERLYGWSAQEAVGQIDYELLSTRFPEPIDEIERKLLDLGSWQGEMQQVCRDGRQLFVSAHWVRLSKPDEQPVVIASHADITARMGVQRELEKTHDQLKRMAVELERSNQELEQFARIASHDLSAPITSTRWLVDLLSTRHAKQLDEEGHKYLKQICLGLDRMNDLVEGVLAHAKVGTVVIGSSESTDAGHALASAIENLRRDIETSGAVITQEDLPNVCVEPRALTQLFQNLLSNAIKYRRPDVAPAIKVTAARQDSMWVMAVEDNGMGIEPEWLERVFEPLQRRHGMEIAGSGLGLATCKKIVTRAGGRIWAESRVATGSTFFFTLPGPDAPSADGAVRSDDQETLSSR
ncbi:MAG: PAS domain S-box protein [Acidobacteriaceae bacterium]|nr:PAS domain S-box protein [Acidobacteriaceae bacterium]